MNVYVRLAGLWEEGKRVGSSTPQPTRAAEMCCVVLMVLPIVVVAVVLVFVCLIV